MSLSLRSPALIRRRRIKIAKKVAFWFLLLSIIIAGPIWLAHADFLRISHVEVIGGDSELNQEIKKTVEGKLLGKYYLLFPRNNSILYPKKEIRNAIFDNFTEVNDLNLDLKSLNTLVIKTDLRKPSALWCESPNSRQCFYIDSSGLVFEEAGDFSDGVYFIYYGNIEGEAVGKIYMPAEKFRMLEDFKIGVRNLTLIPKSLNPLTEESFSLKVSGGEIIFSLRDDINTTLSNLASILSDRNLAVLKDQKLTVSSIDLRFGNKVILKKGAE